MILTKLRPSFKVIYNNTIESVRPFILCCIVKAVDLSDSVKLRNFFRIQTKIHESDVSGKRTKSSIGTHDLSKIGFGGSIHYTAKAPDTLNLVPLGRARNIAASELITTMRDEIDMIRMNKGRKVTSGICKYLPLVENKDRLACLEDGNGNVISLPPLVNSELTKVDNNFCKA